MKKYLQLIPICLLVLFCACNGEATGLQQDDVLMLNFQPVLANVQEGIEVADISAIEKNGGTVGYIVTFADGSGLTLMNRTDGTEGAKVVKGFSENSESWCFELEGGEKITLPKASFAEPFKVEITGDEVEITDGGTVQVAYKVSGATSEVEVSMMMGEGWEASLSDSFAPEGTITVQAPDPITTDKVLVSFRDRSGKQVVRALRLTSKSSVQRGHIDTYVFLGVGIDDISGPNATPEEAHRKLKQLSDAGIDIMTHVPGEYWLGLDWSREALIGLDAAQKAGLKLALYVEYYMWKDDVLLQFVKAVKDHPAFWGYQVKDEPSTEYYAGIEHMRQVIRTVDTEHPLYVNLHGYGCVVGPLGSYKADSYDDYVQRYITETNPEFISFDVYPCYEDFVLDQNWYPSLEIVSRKAKAKGIPFWSFTLSLTFNDGYGRHTRPSMATLRFQDYSSLAYGAQGLEYFTWAAVVEESQGFRDWPIDPRGEINKDHPTAEYLRQINEEVQNRAFVFDGCDVKWAAHYNDIPNECQPVDMTKLPEQIVSFSTDRDLLLTLMENDGGKSEYLNFMSRTHLRPTPVHIRFRYPVQTVERDGSLKTLDAGDYDFTIDPGDILIIKTR